jgi:putative ABC transport system substrate-binding protein
VKRREFITLIGGAAVGWPIRVGAQLAPKVRRIGFLSGASRPNSLNRLLTVHSQSACMS